MRKQFVLIISVFALFLSVSCTQRNSGEKAVLRVIENQIGTVEGKSPYELRNFLNVCAFGSTTP